MARAPVSVTFMRVLLLLLLIIPTSVVAQDNSFRLAVPESLTQSGFMDYLLPRFSLKTSVRVVRVANDASADAAFSDDLIGDAAFEGAGGTWSLELRVDNPKAQRFHDWLFSQVGTNAIEGFVADDGTRFVLPQQAAVVVTQRPIDTVLAAQGADFSLVSCGRCHVVGDVNRMKAIGSTPSFALLRTFADWDVRFQTFYVLRPHAAFTQIDGVTDPFDPARPSPIVPLVLTPEELEAIIAYVSTIAPADLGAALQSQ